MDNLTQDTTDGATNAGGVATVSTGGDRNEWGRVDFRHTRHSLRKIEGWLITFKVKATEGTLSETE